MEAKSRLVSSLVQTLTTECKLSLQQRRRRQKESKTPETRSFNVLNNHTLEFLHTHQYVQEHLEMGNGSLGELAGWAVSCGVKINGIAAHKFPGKGLGIIAERSLQAGEIILEVPMSFIRTQYTLPKRITDSVIDCSVNGLLAADLAMESTQSNALWRRALPQDFRESMPLFWPPELQALLPSGALALLKKQQGKVSQDWNAVSAAFPELPYDAYTHHWMLVSSRTFYYTPPDMAPEDTPEADECLAMIPFGDYFNHSDGGCAVNYSANGYEFTVPEAVDQGKELYISYGNHSNDFLLLEYGFLLEENKWDEVSLDEVILPLFSDTQKEILEDVSYLGKYVLNIHTDDENETVCYRTATALRLLCMPFRKYKRGLSSGFDDTDLYQGQVNKLVLKALKTYTEIAEQRLEQISVLEIGSASQKATLTRRWEQILAQLTVATDRLR